MEHAGGFSCGLPCVLFPCFKGEHEKAWSKVAVLSLFKPVCELSFFVCFHLSYRVLIVVVYFSVVNFLLFIL